MGGKQQSQQEMKSVDGSPEKKGEQFAMRKQLTLADATLLIIGTIIGSGIFISPKGVLMYSGSIGLALIIWAVCGIFSIIGGLCYAEMGTTITKFGGVYIYCFECFGPAVGFMVLWVNVVISKPTSQAIIMLVCVDYILYPIFYECGISDTGRRLLASAGLILLTFLNCVSIRWSARLNNALSYSKILATCIIIGTGMYYLFTGHTENLNNAFANSTPSAGNIALAMYSGLWAYSGWTSITFVTEELTDIPRNLPRSIVISVSLIIVIYLLTNIAYFVILSPTELLNSSAVAVTFADETLGVMAWIMPVFVGLSTFGATNASVFSGGRLFFSGAREEQLPGLFAMIHLDKRTPLPAMLCNLIISLIMLQISDIYTLINYTSFIDWLTNGMVGIGLLWLRYKQPKLPRPLKLNLAIPIIFVLMSIFLVVIPFYTEPLSSGIGLLIMFAGLPLHFLGVLYKKMKPKIMTRMIESTTVFTQMFFQVSETDWDHDKYH